MDYRELNKWMQQDNNPLLNIKIILENLHRELFSKFNLQWGYKNL
jgi:hypothetical protein